MSFAERLCLIFYISFGGSAKLLCLNIFFNVRMNQMTLSQNRTPQSVVRFAMVYFNDVYSKLKYINELIRCKKCLCGIKPQIASKIFIIFFCKFTYILSKFYRIAFIFLYNLLKICNIQSIGSIYVLNMSPDEKQICRLQI